MAAPPLLGNRAWLGNRGVARPHVMLYCNSMTHHHHAGPVHPSPVISPSLLRLSAATRIGIALALIAMLWAAVAWAAR